MVKSIQGRGALKLLDLEIETNEIKIIHLLSHELLKIDGMAQKLFLELGKKILI